MPSSRAITLALLSLLAAASIPCIILHPLHNGTFDLLAASAPPTPDAPPLAAHLSTLISFFWPLVTGALPALSLFGIYMAGQLVAAETLILVEALRPANAKTLLS